ncbi:MAG TPA: TfoX/Sxy family protein [Dehalococcoidia bacterium]|nr:TfoX/Sxy family protein [Dehalococcoidia bacterium]
MNWEKTPPEMVELFDASLPDDPAVQRRKMFGFPAAFVNGNMFASMHQAQMVVRLPKDQYDVLLAIPGAAPFEPMPGRAMSGYAVLPEAVRDDRTSSRAWLERAFVNAAAMPAKQRKPAAKRKR